MRRLILILPVAIGLAGCADMSSSQRSTATGAGVGALGGLAIGSLSGNAGMGALIGTGVGAASGFLIDRSRTQ
jgi:hypothetical protein